MAHYEAGRYLGCPSCGRLLKIEWAVRSLVCSCGARVPVALARRKRRLSSPPAPRHRRRGRPRPAPPARARPRPLRPAARPRLAALPRPARRRRPRRWLGPAPARALRGARPRPGRAPARRARHAPRPRLRAARRRRARGPRRAPSSSALGARPARRRCRAPPSSALGAATDRPYGQDGGVVQLPLAIDKILAGESPYGADYSGTILARQARVSSFWDELGGNPILRHHAYLPGTHLVMLPFHLAVARRSSAASTRASSPSSSTRSSSLLAARLPGLGRGAARGGGDRGPQPARLLAPDLRRERPRVRGDGAGRGAPRAGREAASPRGALLGLACATKQLAWPFAPFLLVALSGARSLPRPRGRRAVAAPRSRPAAAAAAVFLAVVAARSRPSTSARSGATSSSTTSGCPAATTTRSGARPGFGFANFLIYFGRVAEPAGLLPVLGLLRRCSCRSGSCSLRAQLRDGHPEWALATGSTALVASLYFSRVVHPNYLIPAAVAPAAGRARQAARRGPRARAAAAARARGRDRGERALPDGVGAGVGRRPARAARRPRGGARPEGGPDAHEGPAGAPVQRDRRRPRRALPGARRRAAPPVARGSAVTAAARRSSRSACPPSSSPGIGDRTGVVRAQDPAVVQAQADAARLLAGRSPYTPPPETSPARARGRLRELPARPAGGDPARRGRSSRRGRPCSPASPGPSGVRDLRLVGAPRARASSRPWPRSASRAGGAERRSRSRCSSAPLALGTVLGSPVALLAGRARGRLGRRPARRRRWAPGCWPARRVGLDHRAAARRPLPGARRAGSRASRPQGGSPAPSRAYAAGRRSGRAPRPRGLRRPPRRGAAPPAPASALFNLLAYRGAEASAGALALAALAPLLSLGVVALAAAAALAAARPSAAIASLVGIVLAPAVSPEAVARARSCCWGSPRWSREASLRPRTAARGRRPPPRTSGADPAGLVPEAGLEPARISPHAPQTCVSANSTTPARGRRTSYEPPILCGHLAGCQRTAARERRPIPNAPAVLGAAFWACCRGCMTRPRPPETLRREGLGSVAAARFVPDDPRGRRCSKRANHAGARRRAAAPVRRAAAQRPGDRPPAGEVHRRREVPSAERLLRAVVAARPRPRLLPRGGRPAGLVLRRDEVGRSLLRRHPAPAEEGADRPPRPVLPRRRRPAVRGEPDDGGRGPGREAGVRLRGPPARGPLARQAPPSPCSPGSRRASPGPASGRARRRPSRAARPSVVGGGVAVIAGGSGPAPRPRRRPRRPPPPRPRPPPPRPPRCRRQVPFLPVFKVYRDGVLQPGDTIVGPEPLPLLFDMCESSGPFPLRFNVEVDGVQTTDGCQSWITFTSVGASRPAAAPRERAPARPTRRTRWPMRIRSVSPDNEPQGDPQAHGGDHPGHVARLRGRHAGPVVSLTAAGSRQRLPEPRAVPRSLRGFGLRRHHRKQRRRLRRVQGQLPGRPDQAILGPVTSGAPWALRLVFRGRRFSGSARPAPSSSTSRPTPPTPAGTPRTRSTVQITVDRVLRLMASASGRAGGDRHPAERAGRRGRRRAGRGERRGRVPAGGTQRARRAPAAGREPGRGHARGGARAPGSGDSTSRRCPGSGRRACG